jgi:alkylhydroperoxidase family enzyme
MTVRIPPVAPTDNPAELQETLDRLTPAGSGQALNVFGTLAHHPKLLRDYLPFGSRLLFGGEFPDRDRELVILVTAHLCGCAYEWDHHVRMAKAAGLDEVDVERISSKSGSDRWAPEDALLIEAVKQLVTQHTVSGETWDLLAARYSHRQLLELAMLVGHYAMLAGMLNAAGVEHDPVIDGDPTSRD